MLRMQIPICIRDGFRLEQAVRPLCAHHVREESVDLIAVDRAIDDHVSDMDPMSEQSFRFNEREKNDGTRFRTVLSSVAGKRLTYKQLIGNDAETVPT
jgi:hypothetical protein